MPLYEYQCDACGHRFEKIQKFSDAPIAVCPECGGPVHKLLSSPAIQFKGSGFYLTDYGRGVGSKPEGAASKGGKTEGAASGAADGAKSDGAKGGADSSRSGDSSTSDGGKSESASASKPATDSKPAAKAD
jgi:putative FmdB family regulatory protein